MNLYGIATKHVVCTKIGAIYKVEPFDTDYYRVIEGNSDLIRKDSLTMITKDEYVYLRSVQNETLNHLPSLSKHAQEYYQELYGVKNESPSDDITLTNEETKAMYREHYMLIHELVVAHRELDNMELGALLSERLEDKIKDEVTPYLNEGFASAALEQGFSRVYYHEIIEFTRNQLNFEGSKKPKRIEDILLKSVEYGWVPLYNDDDRCFIIKDIINTKQETFMVVVTNQREVFVIPDKTKKRYITMNEYTSTKEYREDDYPHVKISEEIFAEIDDVNTNYNRLRVNSIDKEEILFFKQLFDTYYNWKKPL